MKALKNIDETRVKFREIDSNERLKKVRGQRINPTQPYPPDLSYTSGKEPRNLLPLSSRKKAKVLVSFTS